jgi:hypothetical protein
MRDLTTIPEQLLKPTATIHVGNRLSLIERKVFNAIIWHSQKNRFATNANSLSVALLMSLIGLERSKNTDVIKEALEKLTTNPIIWNTLKKDRTADWGICTFLAGAELSGGQLRYVLNPLLVEKVRHPTLFAKIQLLVQTQFSSKYSLALYEFLLDELCRTGNPQTHTVQVPLDIVRHVLQFDGTYKHLNSDVLKPCVLEINKHADISVGYRGIKKGRAVTELLFVVERTAMQMRMPLDDLTMTDTNEDVGDECEAPLLPEDALHQELIERGVTARKAAEMTRTFDEARIRENIAYAEKEHVAGKVKNLSAYIIRAIEEDYRPKKSPTEQRQEEEKELRQEKWKMDQELEELSAVWHRHRERRVRERFAELPDEVQQSRRDVFVASLKRDNPLLYGYFKKSGFGSRMVDAQFFAELREELLTAPEELSFEAYRATHSTSA